MIALVMVACTGPVERERKPDGDIPVDPPRETEEVTDTGTGTPPIVTTEPTGPPVFPDVIDHLTVVLRTAPGTNAGTDDEALSLCLTEGDCVALELPGVDDFRVGEADTYHIGSLGLPRADVDRVELRWGAGGDRWEPACLSLHFDGEPVHCEERMEGLLFGDGVGELTTWADPEGLHTACDTCEDDILTEGPVLGLAEPGVLRVWLRTDGTREVSLRVSATDLIEEGGLVDVGWPDPDDDYGLVLEAADLPADADVVWQLEIDGVPWGQALVARTAPAADAPVSFDLAFGSSALENFQPTFSAALAAGSDVFLLLGNGHVVSEPSLPAHRAGLRWGHDRADRATLLAAIPSLAVWNDLDYLGVGSDASTMGGDDALRAFGEFWPNPSFGLPDTPGVFHQAAWGDVDVFLLDVRSYREPGTMIGDGQRAWLVDAMQASDATFKLLASPSPFDLKALDGWSSFVAEREGLFGDLHGVEGVVLLTGGENRSELRWIADPGIGYDLPEWSSGPLADWPLGACEWPPPTLVTACYDDGPSFVRLDIDTLAGLPRIVAEIRDLDGNIVATDVAELGALTP